MAVTLTHSRSDLANVEQVHQKELESEQTLQVSLHPCLVFECEISEAELKDEGFIQLKKKKKKGYMCIWLFGASSLFSAHGGFKKCMMNHTWPALMFYSVSCGPSDAPSIIRLLPKVPCEK